MVDICNHQNYYYFHNFEWFLANFLLSYIFSVIILLGIFYSKCGNYKKIHWHQSRQSVSHS